MPYKKAFKEFLSKEDDVLDDSFVSVGVHQTTHPDMGMRRAAFNLYDGRRGEAVVQWDFSLATGSRGVTPAIRSLRTIQRVAGQLVNELIAISAPSEDDAVEQLPRQAEDLYEDPNEDQ